MLDIVQAAGTTAWVILSLAGLGVLAAVVFAAMAAFRLRVPAPLWFGTTFLILWVGYGGTILLIRNALAAIGSASADTAPALAAMGWSEALAPTVLAYLAVGLVLLVQAWVGAIGHAVRVGAEPRWAWGMSVMALLVGGFLAIVQALYIGLTYGWTSPLMLLPAIVVMGAPALSVVTLRVSTIETDGDAGRLVAGRVMVGMSWVGALMAAAIGMNLMGEAGIYADLAAMGGATDGTLVAFAGELLRSGAWGQGFLSVIPPLVVTALAGLNESRVLESGRTVGGAVITVLGLILTLVLHTGAMSYGKALVEATRSAPDTTATP